MGKRVFYLIFGIYLLLTGQLSSFGAGVRGEKLIFAIDVIRHGDRTPCYEAPNMPYDFPGGLGALTDIGKNQEEELGKKMRERYITKGGLLSPQFAKEEIYVRSTDVQRTKESALFLMKGFYPESSFTIDNLFDEIPELDNDPFSGRYKKEDFKAAEKKYLLSTVMWMKEEKKYQGYFSRWSKITGYPIKSINDVSELGDITNIFNWKKLPMPKDLTAKDVKKIAKIRDFCHIVKANTPELQKSGPIDAYVLILKYLDELKIEKDGLLGSRKMVLFSAHDTIIMMLLGILKIPMATIPPYASDLSFQIFKDKNNQKLVKIFYNDRRMNIKGCKKKITCTVDELKKLI